MRHTFTMSEIQASMIHTQIASHIAALKNWIASAVESGRDETARQLVAELREYQTLFAAFNMSAKHTIANATSRPVETVHIV